MSDDYTPADEKALAMNFAYTALVRALCLNGSLTLDQLMAQLAGANQRLHQLGEIGSADFLAQLAQGLMDIDRPV